MKQIIKSIEPISLTRYRSTISIENLEDSNIYEDYPNKKREDCANDVSENIRKQLLEEQGYICCYCMSRINCENSKIEHFKPQTKFRDLQINYQNLFVACSGGEGSPNNYQHCDSKKGEQELVGINLLTKIENQIIYNKKSNLIEIDSFNANIKQDLKILNLNLQILQKNRKSSYDKVISNLKRKGYSIPNIKKIITFYQSKNSDKYEPYCEMIVHFLTKKLKSQGATA